MNETQNLKELVQKAAAGDKESFEKLYQATCRSVYFTCLGLLKDEQEAQDITQDVYLTVFEQLETLEDAGKFKAWLYRIAANKSIKHLRKKQPILSGDEQLEDMETEENENFLPEEYALNTDKRKLVLEITRKVCTDVQYQTTLLYYFNELSIAEIAEIMECLEGTVKNRLSVARQKIKEGVLRYEKKSGDKLYSVAVIPFLTTLFTAQMQDIPMPSFPPRFTDAIPQSKLVANAGEDEDMETSLETDTNETETDEDTLQEEAGTAEEAAAETTKKIETTEEISASTEEPEQEYTYTDMNATMYASQTVNVRTLPDTDGEKVGALSANQEIAVTGQCNETGWYRFEYNGSTAYVSNNYVSDSKAEAAAQSASASPSGSVPFYRDIYYTLQARYPDQVHSYHDLSWVPGGWLKDYGVSFLYIGVLPLSPEASAFAGYYGRLSQLPYKHIFLKKFSPFPLLTCHYIIGNNPI